MEKAKEKKDNRPTKRSYKNHIEAAKDVYVFAHMIQLIEHMSHEISDLREMLSTVGDFTDEGGVDLPDVFAPKKTNYLN